MRENYHYISFLRILAMFAIIGAHTIATPVIYYSSDYTIFWLKLSVILSEICRSGVQIFIAISGALFLQPDKDLIISKLIRKYVLRLFLALLIFGTLFSFMEIIFTERVFTFPQIIKACKNMLENKSWGHLWYLYMLIGLYLITPVLKHFIKIASESEIQYILIILFLFNFCFPIIEKYFDIKIGFYLPLVGTPIFFYLMGYAIHSKIIKIKDCISILMIITAIGIFVFESFVNIQINTKGIYFEGFSHSDLFSLLIPMSVFSLSLNHCRKEPVRFDKTFSELSFGVYIFHAVYINFFYKVLHINPGKMPVIFMWIVVFILTSILSLLTTYILRLLPFIRKYIL